MSNCGDERTIVCIEGVWNTLASSREIQSRPVLLLCKCFSREEPEESAQGAQTICLKFEGFVWEYYELRI